MKKAAITKRTAALALGSAMSLSCLAGAIVTAFPGGRKVAYAAGNVVNVDASMQYQTFDGWGTSLAWWANECGDWTREHAGGTTQRDYIMELLFGEEGLNWNIARYNVGGGENPEHSHLSYDTNMPGFQPGRGAAFDWENGDGSVKDWDETTDARQLWVLNAFQNIRKDIAEKNGKESDAITEFFSNSPPYWMLENQCASGRGKATNLKNDYINDYVNYFVEVYKYLIDQGFTVDLLQPFNESSTKGAGWGTANGNEGDQEGCAFSPSQKVQVINGVMQRVKELAEQDPKYAAGYNLGDEVDTGRANDELDQIAKVSGGNAIITGADKLTYHIYGYDINGAQEIYRRAKANGQKAEMSEITWTVSGVYDPSLMTTALDKYSQSIIDVVKYGAAESYVYWQGMENLTGLIKTGWNYGVLHGVYDNPAIPSTVSGFDLASRGLVYQDVRTCKSYYVAGQYSKYIQPGYHIVEVGDDRSLAAISPDGDKLVIVKENNGESEANLKFNLGHFNGNKITKIYTDPNHDWAKEVIGQSESGEYFNSFDDTVTPYSVTTYVIEGVSKAGSSHIIDESARISKSSLSDIPADEKEALYTVGSWGSDNTTSDFAGGTVYNSGDGDRYVAVRFYGTGVGVLARRKNDSAVLQYWCDPTLTSGALPATADGEVDTKLATGLLNKQQVLRVNDLEEGWHTVYLKVKSGWLNLDGVFVINGADQPETETKPVVTNMFGNNKTLYVSFDGVEGATGYQVEYKKSGDADWTQETVTTNTVTIADNNFVAGNYNVRVKATIGSTEVYSDVCTVKMNATPEGLLYYVDCATSNFSDGGWGRAYGSCQSTFDKNYGADSFTGINWGIDTANTKVTSGWVNEDPFSSIYYGGSGDNKITYKFTIPTAGSYVLTVGGFRPGWGDTKFRATITGTGAATNPSKELTAKKNISSIMAIPFTTSADNKEITVTIPQPDGLSLMAITEADKPVPILAEAKSNYTMNGDYDHSGVTKNGDKYLGEELSEAATLNLVMSDGTKKEFSTANGGLNLISKELSQMADGEYYTAGYTLGGSDWNESWPAMTVYATYLLNVQKNITQEYKVLSPEILYFNIDVGSDGTGGSFTPGSVQNGDTTRDQAYSDSNTWGYVNAKSDGAYYSNEEAGGSVREMLNYGGYVMKGFEPNQKFTLIIGMNCRGWTSREIEIYVGGSVASNRITGGTKIDTVNSSGSSAVDYSYEVEADAEGKLLVSFKTNTNGQNALIAYIKACIPAVIQEEISSGSPALAEIKVGQKAFFRQSFEEEGVPAIELKGLVEGARVYVISSNDTLVDSFVATGATYSWSAWEKVPADAYGLRFTQAKKDADISSASGSPETVVALPWINVTAEKKDVKMEDKLAIIVSPTLGNVPKEVFGSIDSIKVTRPDGTTVDIIGSFFYRTPMNGEHTVTVVCNGVTYSTKIDVKGIEMPETGAKFTPESYSYSDVKITFTPFVDYVSKDAEIDGVRAGIAKMYVKAFTPADANHPDEYEFTEADVVELENGSYSVTAPENGYTYFVKVVSTWGAERVFTYKVTDLIDRTELTGVKINLNYGTAGGVQFNFGADQKGKLVYTLNDGEEIVVENLESFAATKPGKYVLQFLSYNNRRSEPVTYYVTEGTQANLATVNVASDGTVSVTGDGVTSKLYLAGKKEALSNLNVANEGKYYLELSKGKETEIVIIDTAKTSTSDNITIVQPTTPSNNKGGSTNTTDIALTVVFAVLAAAAVAGAVVIVIKRRKVS